jgi:ribonuclease III
LSKPPLPAKAPRAPRAAAVAASSAYESKDPLQALEGRLGYVFGAAGLLQRALTHRSFAATHNERLEFLGDAVLNLAVGQLLFERLGDSDEGDLTRVRAHLVREGSLHQAALHLGLPEVLRLSEGEWRAGGAQRPSMLADAMEAVIGAVFLDGGYAPAFELVRRLFGAIILATDASHWSKDAKTELQEWLQARRLPVPLYRIAATRGEKHAQTFEVECSVPNFSLLRMGEGLSRRAAEQEAARVMLQAIQAQQAAGTQPKASP